MQQLSYGFDETFPHAYKISLLRDLPVAAPEHFYYPGAAMHGGHDGLLIQVSHHDKTWMGTFAFGHWSKKAFSGIVSMPDPEQLCVVATGEGYLVSAGAPRNWESVGITPIMDVRPIPSRGIVVFANCTDLVALGKEGTQWQTGRISLDDLRILDVTETEIHGEYFDPRTESQSQFVVNLTDGTHKGGI